jgi:hypothetical protein
LAGARRRSVLGLLPDALGFLLESWAASRSQHEPLHRTTSVYSGASGTALEAARLPDDVASWGEPTGVAVHADGTGFVLGQRRSMSEAIEERLLRVDLDCRG